ncbi:hypothetical protein G7Y89_g1224 [Cudoniella acicularis]|uniref:2EXR domain-containing protein n=1 Tax=Cudoniella acicularis TaxID=354080 RepID=A0A8H4RXG6_9HELO|nr:hypothetical protein G7Y89_g1224 [Cudoniella acicularis]
MSPSSSQLASTQQLTHESPTSDIQPAGVPPQQFTLFPELPPELQLKIWKMALKEGRIIEVRTFQVRGYPKHSRPITPQPPLLHTCHDSRKEALKVYQLLEVQNPWFSDDDGPFSDVEPDRQDSYLRDHIAASYLHAMVPMRDLPKTRLFQPREVIPTFRTMINVSIDTIYVDEVHSKYGLAALNFISCLTEASEPRANLQVDHQAFDLELLRSGEEPGGRNDHIVSLVQDAWPNIRKVTVVFDHSCCGNTKKEHRLLKGLGSEPSDLDTISEDDKALFAKYKKKLEDYWKELTGLPHHRDLKDLPVPEVVLTRAFRE